VNGAELFCKQPDEGPSLVLMHGVGPDSRKLEPGFEDLVRDHRVIAYYRRGYGGSAKAPRTGGWHQHGEDAAALIHELGAAPAAIAGWSGGGIVALHVAAEHLDLVKALVLAETGLPLPTLSSRRRQVTSRNDVAVPLS